MTTPTSTKAEIDQASFFETWYSLQSPEYGERKQLARDAYTAGAEDATAELAAERAEVERLRKTLASLIGTPEDPNNGWRGNAKTSDEHFACEYCGSEHLDCTLIEHKWNCPVPGARAALITQGVRK